MAGVYLAYGVAGFLFLGAVVAYACCVAAKDPPESWFADAADGETQAPVLPPRLDGPKSHGGAIGGPLFFVQRDLRRRFDARKSERRGFPPAA